MVSSELDKANTSNTEAAFLDLHLSILMIWFSNKIYDKRDDFDFVIINFQFLDGEFPRSTSYEVYISQLIHFASIVADFNTHNKLLTQKLLNKAIGIINLAKHFLNFIDDTII